ncbi:MAG: hypothetical protein A3B70_00500 [Deltaproteobacteria bacterium RIFCSPHIGHO2_02_FULL_40_11]|nr:MAG: hypothetical protein A3B70_00500 [Deltaproteobacteria bacterium RIFCSPHIGHO2_02_FULL_40_11]
MWGPSSSKVHPSILELLKKGVGRFRERIFPTLEENFNRMADPKAQAVHKIVIVPAELKDFVKDMVVARWADLKSEDPNWNFRNQNLFLYQLDQGTIDSSQNQSQDVILENLAVMRELPKGQAPVLLGDLATIRNLGRVEAEGGSDKTFYVQDYVLDEPESGQWGIDDVEPENVLPHLLYLLATEGNRLPLKEFQAATKLPPKRMSMLLVGTEQEWDKIQRDIGIENRFGLSDHFEVEHLKIPDHATRKEMLLGVLERPEVKSLEYHFDSRMPGARKDAISPEQARNEILSIMVSECERRALENKVNIVAAFLKLYQTFRKAVLEDEELRRDRVIDRRFVQRLMARNFRVQLNPELLPPTDYLRLLQNQDLPLQVEKAGYTGSFEMTERVAHILKEQLNPASKLTIPASLIVIGETSSGKTSLVQAFIRVLGLKEYDFEKPHDPGAQVFYLNCRKVVESKSELREGEIAVDDALKHFDHFLTLPHGYRGLVFFDDIHAPKDSVKTKILARLQSLVESENGIWRGRSPFLKDSEIIEVPLQNLSLIVALNPISDQKKIAQFQKRGTKGEPTTEELILASISTDALMFDTSFLVRFSEIIRMDTFSAQAKAPALLAEMRKSGQAIFNTKNRLILVAPESAELIQRAFPNLNARIFLSQAAPALLTAENTDPQASRVQIIVPRRRVLTGDIPLEDIDPDDFFEDDEEDGVSNQDKHRRDRKLQAYIEKYVKSIPISQGYEGPLELLRYVMSSFRFHVYESFIGVLGRDGRFIVDETTKFYKYAPLLHAIRTHLETNRGIRLEEIVLDPKDFGATNKAQEIDFMQALKERDRGVDRGFRPAWIFQPTRGVSLERVFDNMTTGGLVSHSRRDVLNRLCLALDLQLKEYLKVILKISDPELPFPTSKDWLMRLDVSSGDEFSRVMKSVLDLYEEFQAKFYAEGLLENTGEYPPVSVYDFSRIFLIALDRAMMKLPWGRVTPLLTDALDLAANDMTLGELPGVQKYLFTSGHSLVVARTPELPIQMVLNPQAFELWQEGEGEEKANRFAGQFLNQCEKFFDRP